jgi:hypothetical protein
LIGLLGRRRRRARCDLEPLLRPVRWWLVEVRVPIAQWVAASPVLAELLRPREVDLSPPSSGPELQLGFDVRATDGEHAERMLRRVLERNGMSVLAIRSRPA